MTSLTQATIEEMREIAARICRDYLTGTWKSISSKEIKLRRISGGLSNFLYYVSLPDTCDNNGNCHMAISSDPLINSAEPKRVRKDSGNCFAEPKEVLLRIYGQMHGENALETMLTESVVFTLLSERNLGPKLHGIFPGGRIEQYIPARPLATAELSDYKISIKIAEKMAEIHSLHIPVSKEPDWLWNSMDRWLNTIESILKEFNDTTSKNNFEQQIQEIKGTNLRDEVSWIKSIIDMGDYPVVFCHNDLQEGNILLKENTTCLDARSSNESLSHVLEDSGTGLIENHNFSPLPVTHVVDRLPNVVVNGSNTRKRTQQSDDSFCDFDCTRDSVLSDNSDQSSCSSSSSSSSDPDLIIIDYEYCAYNYRGFDFANHFLEWTLDYTNEQFPYFYHHINQYPNNQQRRDFIAAYIRKYNEPEDENECGGELIDFRNNDIQDIDDEVRVFSMVSHLFWCLWGVVNVHQNIEFGYWDYAICRLQQYRKAKEEYKKFMDGGK